MCNLRKIHALILCASILLCANFKAVASGSEDEKNLLKTLTTSGNDTTKINALIKLAVFYVDKPGEDEQDMKQAISFASQAKTLSDKVRYAKGLGSYYLLLSKVNKERGKRDQSRQYAQKAIKIFQASSKLTMELADANLELSNSYDLSSESEVENKILFYSRGVDLLRRVAPNSIKFADAVKFLGDLYNVREDDVKAVLYLKEALAVYNRIGYQKIQDIYSLLGAVLNHMGNTSEGIRYLLLASRTAEKFADSSATVVTLYNRMGNVYNGMNQLENSSNAYQKSLALAEHNKDNDAVLLVASNLSWAYIRMNKPQKAISVLNNALKSCPPTDTARYIILNTTLIEAYLKLNKPKVAYEYYLSIKDIVKEFYTYDFLQANYYNAATKLFLAVRDFDNMSASLDKYRIASIKTNSIRDLGGVELMSFKLDSARGKPWMAIEHFKKFKLLSDSLNLRNHNKELARFQTEFESEKKDLDIKDKAEDIRNLKNEGFLQQRALKGERTSRNLLIGGVILLFMLLGLAYSRYRLKREANAELEKKQIAINDQNDSLRSLLYEREWLLKEIHHRVKNNLQIIISLLDSQSVFLTDDGALNVIRESQHRMSCISLVHQKLYQDDNLSGIEMKDYISELIVSMKDSFGIGPDIRFIQEVEHLMLDVSQAVPLGLILNESITNAIKYAFENTKDGVITIKLNTVDGMIDLLIGDNGCGLPADFDISHINSLGMSLIYGLTKQLGGHLMLTDGPGLRISIKIPRLKILKENQLKVEIEEVA